MPGRWLKLLQAFLSYIDGSLELDTFFLLPTQRQRDVYIMDTVLHAGTFSASEIRQINHCRMHLQAVTLSDLCLADGSSLDQSMLSGVPSSTSSTTQWIQINQAKPHEASWKLWRKVCTIWSPDICLREPLGDWLYPASSLRCQWPAYYDHTSGDLYIRTTAGHTRCGAIDPIWVFPISESSWQPTPHSTPVHARCTLQDDAWIPIISPSISPPVPAEIHGTFSDYLSHLEPWELELFVDLSMEVDCYNFIDLVNSQILADNAIQLLTLSNGSDDSGSMTFGWVISLPNG
jgi:hypothetical protein